MESSKKIRCVQCQHYYITWEPNHPYGCRKLGFKSPIEPSSYVLRISGERCHNFTPKAPRK